MTSSADPGKDGDRTADPDPFASTRDVGGASSGSSRYRILRAIDEGGMGEVFLAIDSQLGREVVIKRPKPDRQAEEDAPDAVSREEQRLRFLRELRVGAILEHPGILPVYDVGEADDGTPFGVMRYLPDGTLHRLVREYHRDHPRTVDEVAFRTLLVHFAAACRALSYAHSRGVVHLDVKPRNIVTGRFGETQVIDWGVAWIAGEVLRQAVEESEGSRPSAAAQGTAAGSSPGRLPRGFRGTRAYASPEQWNEDWASIGTRSDVYGLGATLHEILAGLAPFDARTPIPREDVLGGHLHREPKPWAPRQLVAIARKAMAVEPRNRYEDATLVADDIDRFLADEPVTACRDPWRTRLRRFVKRHRTAVAVTAVLVTTSAVALGVGYVAVSRQRDVALRNLDTARRVIRDFCVEIGDDFWSAIPQSESRRVAMVERAVTQYRRLRADHPRDAVVLRDSADAARRLANLLRVTGRSEEAIPLFDEALADLDAAPDDDATWLDRIETRCDRALALAAAHGPAASGPFVEETHGLALRYRERFPASPFATLVLARTTTDLARAKDARGEREAATLFDAALAAYRDRLGQGDADAANLKLAVTTAVDASRHLRLLGDLAGAARAAADARDWAARLVALDPEDPNHRLLGAMAIRETILAGGDAGGMTIDAAIESLEAIVAEHPEVLTLHRVLAETLLHAATDDLNRGQYAAAISRAERAAAITADQTGLESLEIRAHALYFQGAAQCATGNVAAGKTTLQEAVLVCQRAEELGVDPRGMASLRRDIEQAMESLR